MQDLRGYILSVIVVTVIAAIVKRLMGEKGTAASVGKLLTGLVLTFTILMPLKNINLSDMNAIWKAYDDDATIAVSAGTEIYKEELYHRIKDQSEAYILDKANKYGAQLSVEISLSDDTVPVPVSVVISGNIAPFAKSKMQNLIQTDLGICKEQQQWT